MPESQPTVFVIDDDQAVRKSLDVLIRSVGLKVETYPSAQAFLDSFDAGRSGCRKPGAIHSVLYRRIPCTCLSVRLHGCEQRQLPFGGEPDRGKRKPVMTSNSQPTDRLAMLGRRVSDVGLPAVAGIARRQTAHDAVSKGAIDNGRHPFA